MDKKNEIIVKDVAIRTMSKGGIDYICITDIARQKNWMDPNGVIANWMRNRNTIEFLGIWETLYNPDFNPLEFEGFRQQAGLNAFTLSPSRWIESTNAIGIISQSGRYGGTYAQTDIAFEFASWISVEFRLYLVKEFQRLKTAEQQLLGWTAKEWRDANPDLKGNIRDYASINELICLSNLENLNAVFINDGLPQSERLRKLNSIAIHQMSVLESNEQSRNLLKE